MSEMHEFHDALPGYHPDQILIDGCPECERRAESIERALSYLDEQRFAQAWLRAADMFATTPPSGTRIELGERSGAEIPLLAALWGVQVALERLGLPLGWLPADQSKVTAANTQWVHALMGAVTVAQPAKVAIR